MVHLRVVGRENTATLSVRDTIDPPCGERVIGFTYAVESGCHARAGSLGFEVRYPSDIIVQKWDDVLAVLQLAPNPSRAGEGVRATVEDRPESSGHMEVYDGMGRRVYRAAFEKGTHLLRIDTPGTYLVRAISADGRWTASEKMVIM